MSFILDALKKADEARHSAAPSALGKIRVPRLVPHRARWPWLFAAVAVLAVNAGVIAYVLWPSTGRVTAARAPRPATSARPPEANIQARPPEPVAAVSPAGTAGETTGAPVRARSEAVVGPEPAKPIERALAPAASTKLPEQTPTKLAERAPAPGAPTTLPDQAPGPTASTKLPERAAPPGVPTKPSERTSGSPEGTKLTDRTPIPAESARPVEQLPGSTLRGAPSGPRTGRATAQATPSSPAAASQATMPPAPAISTTGSPPKAVAAPSALATASSRPPSVEPPKPEPIKPTATPPGPSAPTTPAAGDDTISKLKVTVHVWADKPADRLVFINGRKYVQGDQVEDKVLLEEITPEGAMVNYQGRRALLRP